MRLIDADPLFAEIKERYDMFADCEYIGDKARRDELSSFMADIVNAPTIGGWISTNDRMPEKDKDVLVWLYGDYYIGRYNQDPDNLQMRWLFEGFNLYEDNMSYITHWMPLPEPPIEI